MIPIKCEKCGENFEQEFEDGYLICDSCLDKLADLELRNGWNLK